MNDDYFVFVLQKEAKYLQEVISYLVQQELRLPANDFLDDRGILSASMNADDALVLKLKFPYIHLMKAGQVLDMIGQLDDRLKDKMTASFPDKEDYECSEDCDECEDYYDPYYDDSEDGD